VWIYIDPPTPTAQAIDAISTVEVPSGWHMRTMIASSKVVVLRLVADEPV
jgi:hypothetical protein